SRSDSIGWCGQSAWRSAAQPSRSPTPSCRTTSSAMGQPGGQIGESRDDLAIGVALEVDNEVRGSRQVFPAPGDEFGAEFAAAGGEHVDLGLCAGEAEGEPALALAPVFAAQGGAEQVIW